MVIFDRPEYFYTTGKHMGTIKIKNYKRITKVSSTLLIRERFQMYSCKLGICHPYMEGLFKLREQTF